MGQFTPAVFVFLRELAANNNREWWEDNKDRYREVIQEPALDFIEAFGPGCTTSRRTSSRTLDPTVVL